MKVSYPLSLKVTLWLLLNLVLLAVLGIGFFIVQGGLGWGALVAGIAGDRAQATANVIAGEAAATTGENRNAVLTRFGAALDADFYVYRMDGTHVAGAKVDLPAPVRSRLDLRLPSRGPRGSDFSGAASDEARRLMREMGEAAREGREPREGSQEIVRIRRESSSSGRADSGENRDPALEPARRGEFSEVRPPPPAPAPARERERNRWLVRTESPTSYWLGLRIPFGTPDRGRGGPPGFGGFGTFGPNMLVVRLDSFWSLLRFLEVQPWLLAGTGVLGLSVLFWLPLVRGITTSITQLTRATEQIAEGRFDTRVPTDRRDEIGRLGESVNRMASRLDTQMTGQKRFLADVAHELCSPLARMQMASGILADTAPPALAETVTDLREEVQEMSTLVNELLAFTKAGLRPREVTLVPVELAPLVADVLAREDAGERVRVVIPTALRVMAEPELLKRALANLVRNALRYAGDAGPVAATAVTEKQRVLIRVDDEGPGVPPESLERLGDPFFRPESARTRETGGVGLGLAIVRSSVRACRGEVHFSNRTPSGFRAEVRLEAA